MRIISKAQFFRLWEAGVLGNRPRLWRNVEEAVASDAQNIGFRELGRAGGGAWCRVPRTEARVTAHFWAQKGRQFIMDDGCPDDLATLQGEVCRTIFGWEGFLGLAHGLPMRKMFACGYARPVQGAAVIALLDRYMDASSRGDLEALLELYPEASVEFTCFEHNVGQIPGRNTIFWETRDY